MLERRRAIRREADTDALGVYGDGQGGGGGRGGGTNSDPRRVSGGVVEVDASLGTFFEVPDDGREGSANILRIKVSVVFGAFRVVGGNDLLHSYH